MPDISKSIIHSMLWQLRDHPQSSAITNPGRSLRFQGTRAVDPKYTILLVDMIVSQNTLMKETGMSPNPNVYVCELHKRSVIL